MNERMQRFKQADWNDITLRLVKYAVFKVRRLEWNTGKFLPKGILPEDLALEAVRKTAEGLSEPPQTEKLSKGVRRWDPAKQPDLLEYLKGVVDSDVNALVESSEHRLTNYSPDVGPEEATQITLHAIDTGGGAVASAESLMLAREAKTGKEQRVQQMMQELTEMCMDDEEAMLVLMAYQEAAANHEKVKPQLVSRYAGLDEKTARNAMRRLARKVAERGRSA